MLTGSRLRYSNKDDAEALPVGPNGKDDGGPGPEMDEDQPKKMMSVFSFENHFFIVQSHRKTLRCVFSQ